ncbi:MAG: DoxX family protein [Pseudolabrys sp.]
MTDTLVNSRHPVENGSGVAAMARLADRLATVARPTLDLSPATIVQPSRHSPAVTRALATSAAISARAAERARRSRSIVGMTVDSLVAACSFIPYALVALGLRLVMARVFFFDGQTRISGPRVSLNLQGYLPGYLSGLDFSFVVPFQVKAATFNAFLTQYPPLPVPPVLSAYLVSYAEFILPVMLLLGLGTRFAAIGLMIMTATIQIYVVPEALWTMHVYWAAILLVLMTRGPGQISLDQFIRLLARR